MIAKDPLPGLAKTRLTPPFSPVQAAGLAEAALRDTLEVVSRTPAARRVLVLDGVPERWRRDGFDLIPQRGGSLGERLTAAFTDVGGPALLIGMDTPQLTPRLLLDGMHALSRPGVDAVLGRALDGGYWSVGLKHGPARVFDDVPMSTASTWRVQRSRMLELGWRVHEGPTLRDVDTIADARVVARQAPQSRFATALAALAA